MTTTLVLGIILAGVQNLATLKQIYDSATAAGRTDLTPAEIDQVRNLAVAGLDALKTTTEAMPD